MNKTDKAVDHFAEFKVEIANNIMKTIRGLVKSGTVAMSERNLLQVTPTPKNGGPMGTNAQWVYSQMFHEVVEVLRANRPSYRKFIYQS